MAMPRDDRNAISNLVDLARVLSGMEEIRKQQKEANLKIQFVTRKIEEDIKHAKLATKNRREKTNLSRIAEFAAMTVVSPLPRP